MEMYKKQSNPIKNLCLLLASVVLAIIAIILCKRLYKAKCHDKLLKWCIESDESEDEQSDSNTDESDSSNENSFSETFET